MTQKTTMLACESSIITQGIVNNLLPVLLVIFRDDYNISYSLLANLLLLNFMVQLVTDWLAINVVNALGYRKAGILAQVSAAIGLIFIGFLSHILPTYPALIISVIFTAFGGGMLEVMVSPIVENLDYGSSSARMSMLHSFYCWGQLLVVLVTTIFLKIFGTGIWRYVSALWAIIPVLNILLFSVVPIPHIPKESAKITPLALFKKPIFLVMCLLMLCAGAAEIAMAQWASVFAQKALGVDKLWGDILGPCLFAVLMGTGRTLYGFFSSGKSLKRTLILSGVSCFICYVVTGVTQNSMLSLITCAFTGFTVCIMWPGVYSYSAKAMLTSTTAMYGILALFGDMGCALGSWLCGTVSEISSKVPQVITLANSLNLTTEQLGLKIGIVATGIFPLIMVVALAFTKLNHSKHKKETV